MKAHEQLPRKVIVGTCIEGFFGGPNDLDSRIEAAIKCIDNIAAETANKFPMRPCDLICLPEHILVAASGSDTLENSAVDLEGRVLETFAAKAREHNCNIVLPLIRAADRQKSLYYNSAAVIDRKGELVGIYDKIHPVVQIDREIPERGITPGTLDVPVFDLDFGRIGIQICFDMTYSDGWRTLAEKGAELVVWPSASPSTILARCRAMECSYYIVSATFRDNASIYEPTGLIAAQVKEPQKILVSEIDLSWMVLHWSSKLQSGQAFTDKFGDGAGYHFDIVEDTGLFWSNDPNKTIGEMAAEIGVEEHGQWLERNDEIVEKWRKR